MFNFANRVFKAIAGVETTRAHADLDDEGGVCKILGVQLDHVRSAPELPKRRCQRHGPHSDLVEGEMS